MFDPTRLSTESQALLKTLAAKDGNNGDLSTVDLTRSRQADIEALMTSLKKGGYDANEQELVRTVLSLATDTNALVGKSFPAYDFASGDITTVAFSEDQTNPTGSLTQRDVVDATINQGTILHRDVGQTVTLDVGHLNDSYRVAKALEARKTLADEFGFAPAKPYDVGEIQAMQGKVPRQRIPEFMQAYMTAHFVHAGSDVTYNSYWSGDTTNDTAMKALFFDGPAGLDLGPSQNLTELPDGRRVVDCQGFARIGELLFDALIPGEDTSRVFCKAIEVHGPTAGHEMALMRDGDRLYVIDNNHVRPVAASAAELAFLEQTVTKSRSPFGMDLKRDHALDDMSLSRNSLPCLYDVIAKHYPELTGTVQWDDGDALDDH